MKPNFSDDGNLLGECQNCERYFLAQQAHDKYHCLCCGFYRDISQTEGGEMFFFIATFAFVVMELLSNQNSLRVPELKSPNSSHVSFLVMPPDQQLQSYL
jgi:hypothetical protein